MKRKGIIMLAMLLLGAIRMMAVPAYPKMIVYQQPNSEITVNIYLKGDERIHWAETEDGYTLMHDDEGSLVYAYHDAEGHLVPSEYVATDIRERDAEVEEFLKGIEKHLHYSDQQMADLMQIWKEIEETPRGRKTMSDVTGTKKFLVILFGFQDRDFYYQSRAFKRLFNEVNYDYNGATGSVRDYYYDVSHGQFTISVDVVGPYKGKRNMAYYGDRGSEGYWAFAREAVDSAAKDVDFSDYDNDKDGYIDGLHIIFAGYGEEAGASSAAIWSHKFNIYNPPRYNNTVVDVYSCSPELSGNNENRLTRIGVICHELGHVFGAPDFYDTDYSGSGGEYGGLGQWDIMSSGSWNLDGSSPAQHNPYTKIYIYKWATCDTLTGDSRVVVLQPSESSNNDFHRVNTSTRGDFFLIENRQKIKWDRYIPGTGMLVYHVHPDANGASVRNYTHPQQLYIMAQTSTNDTFPNQSPSSYGVINSNTAAYPGPYGLRDSLTDFSVPWFRPWSKARNYVSIYHISEDDETGEVMFGLGNASADPLTARAEGISNSKIRINWKRWGKRSTTIVMYREGETVGAMSRLYSMGDTLEGGGIVVYTGNGTSTVVENLERGARYYFRLHTNTGWNQYSEGIIVNAKTLECSDAAWSSEDFESVTAGTLPECWEGGWKVVEDGESNSVMVTESIPNGTTNEWQSVTTTPLYADSTRNRVVKFRYRIEQGENEQEKAKIRIEYASRAESEWETVYEEEWRIGMGEWTEQYVALSESGVDSRLRISGYIGAESVVKIDDIEIIEGNLIQIESDDNGTVEPMGNRVAETGDTISIMATGLPGYKPGRIYVDNERVAWTEAEGRIGRYELIVSDNHSIRVQFERNLGIADATEGAITVYPNPTEGKITVRGAAGQRIEIYDRMGRLRAKMTLQEEETTIDIERLETGVYILRIGEHTAKIIKR